MIALNYPAILVAALANMLIAMVLYSKDIFGRTWMRLIKKKSLRHQKGSFLIAAIASVLMATVMSFMASIFPRTVWGGIIVGFLSWSGFVATTSINEVIWEGRSPLLFFINNANFLLSMLVMGVILSVWT